MASQPSFSLAPDTLCTLGDLLCSYNRRQPFHRLPPLLQQHPFKRHQRHRPRPCLRPRPQSRPQHRQHPPQHLRTNQVFTRWQPSRNTTPPLTAGQQLMAMYTTSPRGLVATQVDQGLSLVSAEQMAQALLNGSTVDPLELFPCSRFSKSAC